MFTYIDAICLVVFALCILLGVWKGFFHTLSKFFSTTVKLAISFILCKPVAKLISNISHFDEHLFDKYSAWAGGLSENFSVNLKTIPSDMLPTFINDSLASSNVPKIFRGLFKSTINVTPESISSIEQITLAELTGEALKNLTLIVTSFISIFILLTIVLFVVKRLEKRLLKSTHIISKIDRSLGGLVGALRAFIFLFGICLILSIFRNVIIFEGFYTSLNSSFVAGPLSRLMFKIIDSNIDFGQMILDWLKTKA